MGLYRRIENATPCAPTIDCHIGSQLGHPPFEPLDRLLELVDALAAEGISVDHPTRWRPRRAYETRPRPISRPMRAASPSAWAIARALLRARPLDRRRRRCTLVRAEYLKENEGRGFLVVDGAMNDLPPRAQFGWHEIELVEAGRGGHTPLDVVGLVCESADFLGKERCSRPTRRPARGAQRRRLRLRV